MYECTSVVIRDFREKKLKNQHDLHKSLHYVHYFKSLTVQETSTVWQLNRQNISRQTKSRS